MPPSLPHELSDRIVDFLHDDRRALSALSLASRTFLPTTRYHRFSRLVLMGRFDTFSRLLDSSPDVGRSVSSLVFDSGLSGTVLREFRKDHAYVVLEGLPGLQALELRHFKLSYRMIRSLGSGLRLRALSLVGCSLPNFDASVHLVSSFERMDHLHVEDIRFAELEDDAAAVNILPPRILVFGAIGFTDNSATRQICSWVLDGETCRDIRSFHTTVRSRAEAMAMQDVIEHFSGTLTTFHMTVDAAESLTAVFHDSGFSLAPLNNLRSCELKFILREMFVAENSSLPWVDALVSQILSSSVSTIAIELWADDMQDLRSLDSECGVRQGSLVRFDDMRALHWTRLNAVFTSEEFGSLSQVILRGDGDSKGFEMWLHDTFPALGILVQCQKF